VSDARNVVAALNAEVAAGRLEVDPSQLDAATRLDALGDTLRVQGSSKLQRIRSALPWLRKGSATTAPRGVYLWGGVGRGKTLLMDMFYESVQESESLHDTESRHDAPGAHAIRAERSHFYHFMRDVHAELGRIKQHVNPLELVAQRWAARVQVICLDEFFVSDIADAMILAGLFGALFTRGVTLVTTSNLPPQDLYKEGLQRQRFLPAIELIRNHVDVIHLDGGVDYRLRQLEKAPTYLDANDPRTEATLRERIESLAGGSASGAKTLTIEGRTLHAVNTGPGMACFEFKELCEGPRSQNDYIELARLYHTIMIINVPCFDATNDNAARRFIMAIDEFYDRGVKIIVSAAAQPTALYHGERLTFEFERAASRLMEMQAHDYLAGVHRP
jgi:cell division protein ZapE